MPPDTDAPCLNSSAEAVAAMPLERKQFLMAIFTTAIEGGINYWARTEEYHWSNPEPGGDSPEREDLDGYYAVIADLVDNDGERAEKTCRIDAAVILRGVEIIVGARPPYYEPNVAKTQCDDCQFLGSGCAKIVRQAYQELDAGNIDADVADNIVQAGLFGSIVYG